MGKRVIVNINFIDIVHIVNCALSIACIKCPHMSIVDCPYLWRGIIERINNQKVSRLLNKK